MCFETLSWNFVIKTHLVFRWMVKSMNKLLSKMISHLSVSCLSFHDGKIILIFWFSRSSSGASISSKSSIAGPIVAAAAAARKSATPPALMTSNGGDVRRLSTPPTTTTLNGSDARRLSTPFMSEIHKLVLPPAPDQLKQLGSYFKPIIMVKKQLLIS